MLKKIEEKFIISCCGNSFIAIDSRNIELSKESKKEIAKKYIDHFAVDSALFIESSKKAEIFMEIFERDGSQSESCGNGAIAISHLLKINDGKIETKSGLIKIKSSQEKQAIFATMEVSDIKNNIKKDGYLFVKIGEPHAVITTCEDIKKYPLKSEGERIQRKFKTGVNVDVIERVNDYLYKIRTYERGVFSETQSCGTGSLASFVAVYFMSTVKTGKPIIFSSKGGQHWVSKKGRYFKLETLKKYCKVKKLN